LNFSPDCPVDKNDMIFMPNVDLFILNPAKSSHDGACGIFLDDPSTEENFSVPRQVNLSDIYYLVTIVRNYSHLKQLHFVNDQEKLKIIFDLPLELIEPKFDEFAL